MTLYNKTAISKIFRTVGTIMAVPTDIKRIRNLETNIEPDPVFYLYEWSFAQEPDNQFIQQISFNDENLTVILYQKEQLK